MRKILILTAVAVLVNHTAAIAEDNAALLSASYHGGVTGEEEKNTFGYDVNVSSDLQVRFKAVCSFGPSCTDLISTGSIAKSEGTSSPGSYHGAITGDDEKDTFAF